LNVLDLFSGIGGFSLGLERAGMRTVAFCEIEPYCRAVLAKHWPSVPCFPDIRGIDGQDIGRIGRIDVICGGFPCQDISSAGAGAGLAGSRSGLWRDYARLIGLIRPRYVIVENVAALLFRGLGDVLGDLAALGYDTEWHCIPAFAVGANHGRDRVWIVAYPNSHSEPSGAVNAEMGATSADISNATKLRELQCWGVQFAQNSQAQRHVHLWESESGVLRVAARVPNRMDRLRALGNSVIPQIVEEIGRAIMSNCEHPDIFVGFGHCHDCNKFVCDWCGGSGFRTIHGGGSGDPEWDADDQPCSECNDNYSRVSDPTSSAKEVRHE
jgi:DNA (cytosine-5)-methyltransferase 1